MVPDPDPGDGADADPGSGAEETPFRLRAARPDDYESVARFTADTWADRGVDDYLPDAYHEWIGSDGGTRRTFVLDATPTPGVEEGTVAAIVQAVLVSEWEAWFQGMRVNPAFRRQGLATRLLRACARWARERGATVARNWVHSWNVASLGLTRTAGFDTGIEVRFAHPEPDPAATPGTSDAGLRVEADADAAWAFWTDADARTALGGVTLDDEEPWAVSALTREHLHAVAEAGRLFVVTSGGTRGFSYRNRTVTHGGEDSEGGETTVAEYAVGAWSDSAAAAALLAAVARDAATVGADETRVFVPEGIRWAGDIAGSGAGLAEEPSFVTAADLTDDRVLGGRPADGAAGRRREPRPGAQAGDEE